MSDESEFGRCELCGKETYLTRTYFRYNIKCECHSPFHFDLVIHCKECLPIKPRTTLITLKTENL